MLFKSFSKKKRKNSSFECVVSAVTWLLKCDLEIKVAGIMWEITALYLPLESEISPVVITCVGRSFFNFFLFASKLAYRKRNHGEQACVGRSFFNFSLFASKLAYRKRNQGEQAKLAVKKKVVQLLPIIWKVEKEINSDLRKMLINIKSLTFRWGVFVHFVWRF